MKQIDKILEQLEQIKALAEGEKSKPTSNDKALEFSIIITRLDRIILHWEHYITGG